MNTSPASLPSVSVLPTLSPLADRVLVGLLATFGFVLPLSTAAVSIGMALLLVFSATTLPQVWRTRFWRNPVVAAGLVLWAWIATHTAFSEGLGHAWLDATNSYHELLLAALLLSLFRLCSRPWAFLQGLALGTTVYAVAHWLIPWFGPLHTYLTPRYISAGFIMAVTAFVLLDQSRRGAPHARWLQASSAVIAGAVLFCTQGRTGLLLIALLAGYATWCWAPRRWRLIGAAGLTLLLLVAAITFGAARERSAEFLATLNPWQAPQQTSTGIRAGLLISSLETAREHGLLGVGYAGFRQHQEESMRSLAAGDGPSVTPPKRMPWLGVAHPHNEYLMQLISGGVVGLGLFIVWLVLPLRRRGAAGPPPPSLVAATLAFAFGAMFNSLLLDFGEAHFHAALLAWLLSQSPAGKDAAARTA